MISVHIPCEASNDDFRRLANYIRDAKRKDLADPARGTSSKEKCRYVWCAGMASGNDYDLGIREVQITQAMNSRSEREKTYHLLVSFRPEDEPKLTEDVFREIEEIFADSLGYTAHQRVCGVHQNTENIHMHVAYNMIHPISFTRRDPFYDYFKRDKLCRELEQKYGLSVDVGLEAKWDQEKKAEQNGVLAPTRRSRGARTIDSNGHESFETYLAGLKEELSEAIIFARSWQDMHKIFASFGLGIAEHGAGMIVKNRNGKERAKISSISREFSSHNLRKRFGKFEKARGEMPEGHCRYEYRMTDEARKLRQDRREQMDHIKSVWEKKRLDITADPDLTDPLRRELISLTHSYEAAEKMLVRIREKESGGMTWGNLEEMSRKQVFLEEKAEILSREILGTATVRKSLIAAAAMRHSLGEGRSFDVKTIDSGTVVFTLADGKTIRDTGDAISYEKDTADIALQYMMLKWGAWKVNGRQDIFRFPNGGELKVTPEMGEINRPTSKQRSVHVRSTRRNEQRRALSARGRSHDGGIGR